MNKFVLVAVAASLAFSQASAQSAYDSEIQSRVMALERLVRVQALPGGDFKTLDAALADEFVLVSFEGRSQSKTEVLASLRSLDSLHYVIQDMVVRVHGDTAIVTGRFQMSGLRGGKPFARQGRFVDTCLNSDGRWLIIASVSTPAS
ncbi:MAG: nuclear transport factor 2 family protein [Acidobacteriota bacterium]|jgi:ketosteroid isomerase-like protein